MSSTTAQTVTETVTPLRTLPGKKHSIETMRKIARKNKEHRKRQKAAEAEVEDLDAKEQVLLEQLRVLQEQKAKTDEN
jgi:hypothetical protein